MARKTRLQANYTIGCIVFQVKRDIVTNRGLSITVRHLQVTSHHLSLYLTTIGISISHINATSYHLAVCLSGRLPFLLSVR